MMTHSVHNHLFKRLKRYLPPHLAEYLRPNIATDAALTIAIHITSVRYVLSTYLPRYLVDLIAQDPTPGKVSGGFRYGTVMFADVSGFTAMSEKLSVLGKEGAEEITAIVNEYFDTMLDISAEYGGDLLKFGGDALLIFFEGEDGAHRAVVTAQKMQQAMTAFVQVKTSLGEFPLKMSIGMGTGPVFLANLGTVEGMEYAVMGRALSNMAKAEDRAAATQVMVDQNTKDAAADIAEFSDAGDDFWLLENVAPFTPSENYLSQEIEPPPLLAGGEALELLESCLPHITVIEGLRPFVPDDLLSRLIAGPQQPSLPGSHRPVTVMFANFYGIDEIIETLGQAHEDAITQILNTHFVTMSRILARFGGVVNKVDTYAIGHRIMALFGALHAHEDDPQRAVRAAVEMNRALGKVNERAAKILSELPSDAEFGTEPLKQRIGLNSGFVFAGNVGSTARREYSVMGDEVNLTARLMGIAKEGDVLISQSTARHVRNIFELQAQEPVKVKGKSKPVANYVVSGERERPQRWANLVSIPIVGRAPELKKGYNAVEQARNGQGNLLILSGVSGIGKTRLAEEIAYYGERAELDLLAGTCLSYGHTLAYHPWAELLRAYFDIHPNDPPQARIQAVQRGMAAIDEADWLPIIADVLGLDIPDNDLTRALDAKLRRQRIFDLTLKLLQKRAAARPLIVVIEDAHWADPASMELITYVARNIAQHPVLLILPHRPDDGLPDWAAHTHATSIVLGDLDDEACLEIVYAMVGRIELPASIRQLILSKGDGNPFFISEVVRVLMDSGALEQDEGGQWRVVHDMAAVELPDTIHGMIISRIDRLLETDRRILQTASVVGRVFGYRIVDGVYVYGDRSDSLHKHLNYLSGVGLTELADSEDELYRFKHLTTREVVYESLSFEQRRGLHRRIATFIEKIFHDTLGEQISLLAYHTFEGQDWGKALYYNMETARHAQKEFANDTALSAYLRVLEAARKLEADEDTYPERLLAHESLGEVLTLLGRYDEALEHYAAARKIVEGERPSVDQYRHLADLCRKTADVYEKRSEYDTAFEWLEKGLRYLDEKEATIEAARIYLLGAGVYFRQGKNEEAIAWCERSLAVSSQIRVREAGQAMGQAYYLLGAVYTRRGDFNRAVQFCSESVRVYQNIDDIVGLSHAYNNLGMVYSDRGDWEKAGEAYRKSLTMKQTIGDVLYQAFLNNNLGNIHLYRGEWQKALHLFEQSYIIWKQVGAMLPEAVTASNMAQVYIYQADWYNTQEYLSHSQTIFTKIGSDDFLPELERRWGELYLRTSRLNRALSHIRRSIELAVKQEARLEEGMSCRMLGLVHLARGETGPAEIVLGKSLKTLTDLNSEYEAAKTKLALARLMWQSAPEEAQAYLGQATEVFEKLGAKADLSEARELAGEQAGREDKAGYNR